jgi:hypothetical protein
MGVAGLGSGGAQYPVRSEGGQAFRVLNAADSVELLEQKIEVREGVTSRISVLQNLRQPRRHCPNAQHSQQPGSPRWSIQTLHPLPSNHDSMSPES